MKESIPPPIVDTLSATIDTLNSHIALLSSELAAERNKNAVLQTRVSDHAEALKVALLHADKQSKRAAAAESSKGDDALRIEAYERAILAANDRDRSAGEEYAKLVVRYTRVVLDHMWLKEWFETKRQPRRQGKFTARPTFDEDYW